MLLIKEKQFDAFDKIFENNFIQNILKDLKIKHPEFYALKNDPAQWQSYISETITMLKRFNIYYHKNIYMYILLNLQYPDFFTPEVKKWILEILCWPGKNEKDKIALIYKRICKYSLLEGNAS